MPRAIEGCDALCSVCMLPMLAPRNLTLAPTLHTQAHARTVRGVAPLSLQQVAAALRPLAARLLFVEQLTTRCVLRADGSDCTRPGAQSPCIPTSEVAPSIIIVLLSHLPFSHRRCGSGTGLRVQLPPHRQALHREPPCWPTRGMAAGGGCLQGPGLPCHAAPAPLLHGTSPGHPAPAARAAAR